MNMSACTLFNEQNKGSYDLNWKNKIYMRIRSKGQFSFDLNLNPLGMRCFVPSKSCKSPLKVFYFKSLLKVFSRYPEGLLLSICVHL